MNVASLELCRELYEVSDWFDTYAKHYLFDGFRSIRPSIKVGDDYPGNMLVLEAPAYDLGYLLRKLPREIESETIELVVYAGHWEAAYSGARDGLWNQTVKSHAGDTPEDAAAKLAIELFKQGILTHE